MDLNFRSFQSKPKLSALESLAVKCLLTKTAHKISIISQLLPQNLSIVKGASFRLSAKKMPPKVVRIELPENKAPEQQKTLQYVQKHSQILANILGETVQDIESTGSVNSMEHFLLNEIFTHFNQYEVKQENIDSRHVITILKETIKNYTLTSEKTQNFLKKTEPCLEAAVTTAQVLKETAKIRNQSEQESRVKQNDLKLEKAENSFKLNIYESDSETKTEERIHSEIYQLLEVLIAELQTKLDYWSERYNNEIDKLDINILQTQNKIDENKNSTENLQNMILKKEELLAELDQEIEKLKESRRQSIAARVIQKWWRSVLMKRRQALKSSTVKATRGGSQKGKNRKSTQKHKSTKMTLNA